MIPVPWLISVFAVLITALVVSQTRMPTNARMFFAGGMTIVAGLMGLIGLRVASELVFLTVLQPHLAILAAPLLWLGFRCLTAHQGRPDRRLLLRHGAFALSAQCALLLPAAWGADVVVMIVNATYVVLMAKMLSLDADAFVQVAPENYQSVRIALAGCVAFFAALLLADAAIIAIALSAGDVVVADILSGVSGVVVLAVCVGIVVGLPIAMQRRIAEAPALPARDEDHDLLERLNALMRESEIYKDPGLTLARLGRRLGCPARTVSAAVNRVTGENISRFINAYRTRHAAWLLETTELPVTEVMLEAGFVSKSTFNAEFRRIFAKTPSEYRKSQRA